MKKNDRKPLPKWLYLALAAMIALAAFAGQWFGQSAVEKDQARPLIASAQAEDSFKTLKKGSGGEEVRRAQQALSDLGYYEGAVSGNFSKEFEKAVKAFQADFGVPETGELDWDTYSLITQDLPDVLPESKATKAPSQDAQTDEEEEPFVVKGEWYSDKEHVAAYLFEFGELPENYITKKEAQDLGWVSSEGNLWEIAPGMSIGGDRFGNYEGLLPEKKGRQYYECDIDFEGEYRNGKRIVFSNDGLIFYTEDHYESFEEIKQ